MKHGVSYDAQDSAFIFCCPFYSVLQIADFTADINSHCKNNRRKASAWTEGSK